MSIVRCDFGYHNGFNQENVYHKSLPLLFLFFQFFEKLSDFKIVALVNFYFKMLSPFHSHQKKVPGIIKILPAREKENARSDLLESPTWRDLTFRSCGRGWKMYNNNNKLALL